jgi:hypothetical protein
MNPKQIIALCHDLKLAERRQVDEEYAEVVFFTRDLEHWQQKLEGLLGPAVKPAGCKPDKTHEALANPRGGVRKDQILYNKKFDNRGVVALLWPWQDGASITLKIFSE